ncbi:hypothetical protein NQ314_005820 [Rhamnusium bicolor]|uniref:CS domain-containing protein n=1 Tax=Rhamnusium bicolor TaxID=1586634 RepID=A0AAV8ZF75_9CUCU|nr:hypothetical protein NQ314_005820 [Rhamnusium bicolor]
MANKIEELKKDIAELESLEKQATRQKSKDILSIEIRKLVSDVLKLEEQMTNEASPPKVSSGSSTACSVNKRYEIRLKDYAWDQTNKFVKFYVTLKNVHSIPAENIKCDFTSKSLELTVKDLDNKDYAFKIINLLKMIDPDQSNWKVKTDMVIINAAKKQPENWSHVTEWEKKSSDAQKIDTNSDKMGDPSEGLMSLMKNM